jgi:2-polyprenyl-3-methyl-5-hydroxy-6-metoxy-1,4-benzoquinol methylase
MPLRVIEVLAYCRRVASDAIYRQHAGTYARFSEHSLPNACYDRRAILRLAGDVAGRRVLDLGCAAGVLTGQLARRGADVLALDGEPRMAALARQRLQGRARRDRRPGTAAGHGAR